MKTQMIILSFMEHDGWIWLIVMFGSQQLYSKASSSFFLHHYKSQQDADRGRLLPSGEPVESKVERGDI